MRTLLRWALVLACLSLGAKDLWADHGGGGAGSVALQQTISDKLEPPRTNIFFNFEVNFLDEGVGGYLLYQLQGEYAFTNRFSLGGRIPAYTVWQDFVPDNTRLGDVAIFFKGMPWVSPEKKMSLLLGLDVSFPTGNDTVSLGAGAVVTTPFLTYNKDFGVLKFYVSAVGSFELASIVNPAFSFDLGLVFPVLKGAPKLDLFIGFQGTTFITGDTFTDGSTKAFITPGVLLGITDNWEMSFLGRISVLDTLEFRSDVSFDDFATGLFTDIKAGFMFNVGYRF